MAASWWPRGRWRQAATGTRGAVGSLRSLESACVSPSARAPHAGTAAGGGLGTGSVPVIPVGQGPLRKGLPSTEKSNSQGGELGPTTPYADPSRPDATGPAASPRGRQQTRPFSGHLPLPSGERCPRARRTNGPQDRSQDRSDTTRPVPSRGAPCGLCVPRGRGH